MPGAVLVPVDGSNFSEHALPCGLAVARRRDVPLHLVLVHVPFQPVTPRSPIADLVAVRSTEQQARETAYMADLTERLGGTGVPIRPTLLDGHVPEAVTAHVERHDIGVVVMTTHGRGGLQRAWLGSNADTLMRQCPAPLILIRPGKEERELAVSRDTTFRRLLVALDGSHMAERALRAAVDLDLTAGASLVLAHVLQPPLNTTSTYVPHVLELAQDERSVRKAQIRDYLDGVARARWLAADGIGTRLVVDHDPARAILDLAAESDADLIVLGTHGRGGLRRMLMGSVADKVIRGTSRAVLVHRGLPRPDKDTNGGRSTRKQPADLPIAG